MEERYYFLNDVEYDIPRDCIVKFVGKRLSKVYPLDRIVTKSDYDRKYLKEVHEYMIEDEITEREAEKIVKEFDAATKKYAIENDMKVNTWN